MTTVLDEHESRLANWEETRMFRKTMFRKTMLRKTRAVGQDLFVVILASTALLGQTTSSASSSLAGMEFPVVMQENVVAGKTPVGTKVAAKLMAATLVDGVVVPRGATLSGEITDSVKKSTTDPSRLAICMGSATWKNGSAPIKVYLTAWYYPEAPITNQDLSHQPQDAANSRRNWNGMGTYPDPNNPVSQQKFPAGDANKDADTTPGSPASSISNHRVLMKNVDSAHHKDGAVVLISKHSNLKLDKVTTYVLAAGDLLPIH
jgi:hypothetical protein